MRRHNGAGLLAQTNQTRGREPREQTRTCWVRPNLRLKSRVNFGGYCIVCAASILLHSFIKWNILMTWPHSYSKSHEYSVSSVQSVFVIRCWKSLCKYRSNVQYIKQTVTYAQTNYVFKVNNVQILARVVVAYQTKFRPLLEFLWKQSLL